LPDLQEFLHFTPRMKTFRRLEGNTKGTP
jgi:hypothetical protein